MKRIFLLMTLFIATMTVSAQYYMQVWKGNAYTEYATTDIDSVTFLYHSSIRPDSLPYISPIAGKVVVAVNFATEPCNDVVATGDFVDGAWGADTKVKFEKLNSDGWYTATIEFVDAKSYTALDAYADARALIKPIQLQDDGSFSWDGQWYGDGDKLVEVVEGVGYYLDYNQYNGESQLVLTADALGQVIYVKAYGWKVDPCIKLPVAEEAWIKHASADDAENWIAEKMDKVADGTFTHTFVYAENGVNIGTDESCTGWYAPESIEGLDVDTMAGMAIKVTFISESGTKGIVKAELADNVLATTLSTYPTSAIMYVDSTLQLTAPAEPKNAKITWISDDLNTASVDANGIVTAKSAGDVKIYAISGNLRAATKITIYDNPVTCQLKMVDVLQKKCTVHITPSNETGYYYCGYIKKDDIDGSTDEEIKENIITTLQYYVEQYQAAGYDYTMADFLKQGEANLIASGMTANTEYVMFAFGIDVINEKAVAAVTRLPFTTIAVVPSNLTFNIKCDSVTSTTSTKGVTTNKAWFTVNPSNEDETYLLIGGSKAAVEEQGSIEAYATYMEQYYDQKYSSYGGVDYVLRSGNNPCYMTVNDSTEYIIAAAGYNGGFTTKVYSLNYKYETQKESKPARIVANVAPEDVHQSLDVIDKSVIIIPGMCHE